MQDSGEGSLHLVSPRISHHPSAFLTALYYKEVSKAKSFANLKMMDSCEENLPEEILLKETELK